MYAQIENSKDAQLWPYQVSTIVKVIACIALVCKLVDGNFL